MLSTPSIDEMRAELVARREQLRAELLEVDKGLKALDDAVSAYQRVTAWSVVPLPIVGEAKLAPAVREEKGQEKPYTHYVLKTIEMLRDRGEYDPVTLTPEVNLMHGLDLTQNQVSVSLRNLERSRKLVMIKKGGPRKPAIYALPGAIQPEVVRFDIGQNETAGGLQEEA